MRKLETQKIETDRLCLRRFTLDDMEVTETDPLQICQTCQKHAFKRYGYDGRNCVE